MMLPPKNKNVDKILVKCRDFESFLKRGHNITTLTSALKLFKELLEDYRIVAA